MHRKKFKNFFKYDEISFAFSAKVLYNRTVQFLRSWRNWQTRTVQVRVGDHGGSNPFDRTIMKETSFWVSLLLCIQAKEFEHQKGERILLPAYVLTLYELPSIIYTI